MVISGIIRPPPEIRAVADKTAAYVAKNGRAFEERILSSNKGKTPKFAFLHQSSPFHAYYEDRIQFYENGGEDNADDDKNKKAKASDGSSKDGDTEKTSSVAVTKKKGIAVPTARKQHKRQKASAMEPIAKALHEQRTRIAAHRAQHEKERERNRKQEQQQSDGEMVRRDDDDDEKEQDAGDDSKSSPILAPLKPPPPLDFVSIVAPSNMSQTQIETIQLVAQFTAMDGKGGQFLHQLTVREWNNQEFGFVQPRHAHFAYFSALVDAYRKIIQEWTSPEVLSSRTFHGNDNIGNGDGLVTPQMVLQDIAYRVEYERDMEENEQEEGEIIPINWHDFVVVETIDFPADEIVEAMLPPPPSLQPLGEEADATANMSGATASAGDAMEEYDDVEEEDGETIRVVPSYTPKVVGTTNLSSARAIDPITGKSVAVADMPEHLRIQLLDPKWAEERKKFQDKQKDSNLVSDDAIVSNINRLARARAAEDQDGKSGLSGQVEANRILREQAQGPGPSLAPQPPPPPPLAAGYMTGRSRPGPISGQPDPKRQRLDPNMVPVPSVPQLPQQHQFKVTRAPPILPPPSSGTLSSNSSAVAAEDNLIGGVMQEPTVASDLGVSIEPAAPPVERKILPEQEFVATLDKPEVTLNVRVPNDPTQMAWNFYGQIVTVNVDVMMNVKDIKAELSKQHLNDMPPNKIELRDTTHGSGFLKNNQTLAALNIGPVANLEMKLKQRGSGRKG
jgi:splicing factor 3A subunit 1